MITSIIVDDEKRSCNVLKSLLREYCEGVSVVDTVHSVRTAVESIYSHRPDVVFLDIQLNTENGFSILEQTNGIHYNVVFITAYDQYALRAIKHSAVDYLLKPIGIDELMSAVAKCRSLVQSRQVVETPESRVPVPVPQHKLALATPDEILFVEISDIIRMKADRNYTCVYMSSGERYLVAHTLKDYEELLVDHAFIRIHHSHLVNLNRVKKYVRGKGGCVVMSDGSAVEVSVRKKDELLRALAGV